MAKLLQMKSGSSFDPFLVSAILKFAKKGVVFRNEYNKIMHLEPESDSDRQAVIAAVVTRIANGDRDWVQPDWDAEFTKIVKPAADVKLGTDGQNKAA